MYTSKIYSFLLCPNIGYYMQKAKHYIWLYEYDVWIYIIYETIGKSYVDGMYPMRF